MAETPRVDMELVGEAGGIGTGTDLLAVVACSEKGPLTPRLVTRTAAMRSDFGRGEGLEFSAHYIELTRKSLLFQRAEAATPGAVGPVDTTGVTGSSVVTFSGTPLDEESLVVEVTAGGTVGAAGIFVKVSRDGGATYTRPFALGTATSYAIGDSGVTVVFAAGTLAAGDRATARCTAPMWGATEIADAIDALGTYATQPRHAVVIGDVADRTALDAIEAAVTAYEAKYGRKLSVFFALRDQFAPAAMQGAPADVDFAATGDTITRATGSWVTDGFRVGMTITIEGTSNNDGGEHVVTNVASTVLTVASSPGLVDEANVDGGDISIVGVETMTSWVAALALVTQGATPTGAKTNYRLFARGQRARRFSPLYSHRKRRPGMWFEVARTMERDVHQSSMETGVGPLPGVDIDGEFDQRTIGGLLEARIGCLQTHDDLAGAYPSVPVTLAEEGSSLSRVPTVAVGQLACRVTKQGLTRCFGQEIAASPGTGYIAPASADRIEKYVQGRLNASLLSVGPSGKPRAVSVVFELSRVTDIREPGTEIPYTVDVDGYVYAERFTGTVNIAPGGRS